MFKWLWCTLKNLGAIRKLNPDRMSADEYRRQVELLLERCR